MSVKVIAKFTKLHEAYLARARLDTEGIVSFVFDEYLIGVHPLYSAALGGVKIAVHEYDCQEANEILMMHQEEQKSIFENSMSSCPNCHSKDIRKATAWNIVISLIFIFSLGAIWLVFYKKRKCFYCGHRQAW